MPVVALAVTAGEPLTVVLTAAEGGDVVVPLTVVLTLAEGGEVVVPFPVMLTETVPGGGGGLGEACSISELQ